MPFEISPKFAPAIAPIETDPRKRLAALIREGIKKNPGEVRMFWTEDGGPCCAIGAAAAALGYCDKIRSKSGGDVITFMHRWGIAPKLIDDVSGWHTCGLSREKCADRLEARRRWWQFWR